MWTTQFFAHYVSQHNMITILFLPYKLPVATLGERTYNYGTKTPQLEMY